MIQALRKLFTPKAAPAQPVTLAPGQTVTTEAARLMVDALPPGTYRFSVTATDEHGMVSEVASCIVEVRPQ